MTATSKAQNKAAGAVLAAWRKYLPSRTKRERP